MQDIPLEDQQWQRFKLYMKQYGHIFVITFALTLIVVGGWHGYQSKMRQQAEAASVLYEQIMAQVTQPAAEQQTAASTSTLANDLVAKYPRTPYAALAKLLLAHQAVTENQLPQAIQHLQWIVDRSRDESLQEIAKMRIARLYLVQKQYGQALALLEKASHRTYIPLIKELKGDVCAAVGATAEARQAYTEAMQSLPQLQNVRPLLEMKLASLPAAANNTAACKQLAGLQ